MLLIVALSASMAVSSCSKDKDDDPSSSSLVGTWYYMDEDGDLDYDDYFVFKSNGNFTYAGEDNGTYKFNESSSTLTLYWEDDDVEKIDVEFLAKGVIYLDDWGIYKKK